MTDYTVTLTHDSQELFGLAEAWDTLVESNPRATVFVTHRWMTAWWEAFGTGSRLWLFQVCAADGKPVGIAPFIEQRRSWGPVLRWRQLSLLGSGYVNPDHLDLIAHPDHEEGVAQAVLDALLERRDNWDTLYLHAFWPDSALRTALHRADLDVRECQGDPCPYTPLPDSWETFQQEALSKDLRKKLKRYTNRLEADYPGQVTFRAITAPDDLARSFDRLVEHHRSRMTEKGKYYNAFETPQQVAFHRAVAEGFLRKGWLHFHALNVAGQDVAFLYCFIYKGRVYDYQSGFDVAWGDYSPGHLLTAHSIQQAIRKGVAEYDMLLGAEGYKGRYTDAVRHDIHIEAISPSAKRRIALRDGFESALGLAKRLARRVIPQGVIDAIRRRRASPPSEDA